MTDNSLALVTGGANRIGASICRQLHQGGYDIVLHYRSSGPQAEALATSLNTERAGSCQLLQADLANTQALTDILAQRDWHQLELLVNNASLYTKTALAAAQEDSWDALLNTNLRAPWLLARQLAPQLQQNAGSIINILDAFAGRPQAEYALYNLSKNGLASLTRQLALELAPAVRVNGVAPGAILWPESEELDSAERQRLLDSIPLQRLGQCDDIAATVAFLAREAPYITGQIIAVDGGASLSPAS